MKLFRKSMLRLFVIGFVRVAFFTPIVFWMWLVLLAIMVALTIELFISGDYKTPPFP